jgi:signal transduction histidine kinase
VNADPAVIDQAIANLVLNAWDAMPDGGILTVRTENLVAVCPGQADIAAGRFVCLSVSDTGVGIEESARPHLFEPFYTTRRPARGMGLGLPVVYGVVRAHDGWVEVDSTPGRGSTFRINLPAVEEAL